MKFIGQAVKAIQDSLTPHGVSGLKYGSLARSSWGLRSHPAWGEWIEIFTVSKMALLIHVSPRMG